VPRGEAGTIEDEQLPPWSMLVLHFPSWQPNWQMTPHCPQL
jgi:hypothetical protein